MIDEGKIQQMVKLVTARQRTPEDRLKVVAKLDATTFCQLIHETPPEYIDDVVDAISRTQEFIDKSGKCPDGERLVFGYKCKDHKVHWHIVTKDDYLYYDQGMPHISCEGKGVD